MITDIDTLMLRGELRRQEPMSRHTSWKTGGIADYYYKAADIDELSGFMEQLPAAIPLVWIGFGSNLLIRDGGIRGVVISAAGMPDHLERMNDLAIRVSVGVACAKVARFAAQQNLSGAEFLASIPGTIGGALAMNAGAFGDEIWNHVEEVNMINRAGECVRQCRDDIKVSYRNVMIPPEYWFVSAVLGLKLSSKAAVDRAMRDMLARRADTQPLGQHSGGSVFKNPPGDYAARLIEQCDLKGKQIGGARVSEKHANFIINTGNATSLDIEQLIGFVRDTVDKKYAIKLTPEVRIIGDTIRKGETH